MTAVVAMAEMDEIAEIAELLHTAPKTDPRATLARNPSEFLRVPPPYYDA